MAKAKVGEPALPPLPGGDAALVRMARDEPQFDGGPLAAEVHPAEVDNWRAFGWRLEEP